MSRNIENPICSIEVHKTRRVKEISNDKAKPKKQTKSSSVTPDSSLSEAEGDESPPFRPFIERFARTPPFLLSLARLSPASHRATIRRGDEHCRLVDPSLRRRQSMPKSTTQSSSSSSSASMSATRMRWFLESTGIGFWERDLKKRLCFIWGLGSVSVTTCCRGD